MSSKLDHRETSPGLYEILQDGKVLDTAAGVTSLQSKLGRHKARIHYEELVVDRNDLRERLKVCQEVIAGYQHHIALTEKSIREMDARDGHIK